MTSEPAAATDRPLRTCDLATVVEAGDAGCIVRFLDGGRTAPARLAAGLRRRGVVVAPCHLVVVASTAGAAPDAPPYEVIWRGPAVATVTALAGHRLTYDTAYPPERGVTRTLRDARPEAERHPVRAGQQVVVARAVDD